MNTLKDYPAGEWLVAADTCRECGQYLDVKIIDVKGNYGNAVSRCGNPNCKDHKNEVWHVIGWEYNLMSATLRNRTFHPFRDRADIGPCSNCEKLIIDVPITLFIGGGKSGQLDFCDSCFKGLGLKMK